MHPGVPFQSPYQASTTKPLLATIDLLGLAPLFSSSFSTNEQKASIKHMDQKTAGNIHHFRMKMTSTHLVLDLD